MILKFMESNDLRKMQYFSLTPARHRNLSERTRHDAQRNSYIFFSTQ